MVTQYFDIIVLLLVVLVIYNKYRTILGTRPDETEIKKQETAKMLNQLIKEVEQNLITENKEQKIENSEEATDELANIPGFSKETFLSGAKRAFEIIIEAFNKGDVETLEMLVNKDLLKKFQQIIEQRKAEGITAETDFIGFNKAEIIDAKVNKNQIAKVTVEFISEQVNMLKNAAGAVIEGDDKFIQCITDKWTFEKAITSTNPNWLLVSTKK